MQPTDYEQLLVDIKSALAFEIDASFAIIGHTPLTYDLLTFFRASGVEHRLSGIYCPTEDKQSRGSHKAVTDLTADAPDIVIIASDEDKEELLLAVVPFLRPATRILLAGYGHLAYRNPAFAKMLQDSLVPSLAYGYPHTLPHIYQCLANATRLDVDGVVVEFGMFKGGTTMLLSRFIEHLGKSWKVIGFDSFSGFPSRRSPLDMFDHPRSMFLDEASVRNYLEGRNVEIVVGDIVDTAKRLSKEDVVLAFVDTDNYSSATAVLDAIQDRVVVGGAIVFDHFTGRNRFCYTLGERLAAKRLLLDRRYFHLHDTGVFMRQC